MKKFRLILILAVLIVAAFLLRGKIPHEKFNSVLWKTANLNLEKNLTLRWDMMNDLRTRYKLVGMKKKDIIKLLGEPLDSNSTEYRYYLGYSRKGINTGSLLITFEGNIVSQIKVWQG